MTPRQREALEIIRDHGPLSAKSFADFFWPGRHWMPMNCGRGVSRTRTKSMCAGGYLGRLRAKGWISQDAGYDSRFSFDHKITEKGLEALKDDPDHQSETGDRDTL